MKNKKIPTTKKGGEGGISPQQKQKLIDAIIQDNPQLAKDTLQKYYIEQMVESYLYDPDDFNRKTTEAMKEEKKKKKESEVVVKPPEEIVCISKIEAEQGFDPARREQEEGVKGDGNPLGITDVIIS